jgi:hypothetical protein
MLQESRRQACVAIDFYNRSGDERSYLDFVIHMHLGWQYLLQAERVRDGLEIHYRDSKNRYLRTKDGDKKTWDLQSCADARFPMPSDLVRANLEFFIGLRNKVEHRYQDSLIAATAGQAHALVINYETELVGSFGGGESLGEYLRFPVFVQTLSRAVAREQLAMRRRLPADVKTYITEFESSLDKRVSESERYDYRVLLVQVKGSKTEADAAVTFVRAEDLTEERLKQMEAEGKVGAGVIVEKQRDVMHSDELAPAEVLALMDASSPFRLNMWHFTELCKLHGVKPKKGQPPVRTDRRYCIYDKPWKKYVYTQAFVRVCIDDVSTREKFRAAFGKDAVAKVSSLTKRADMRATAADAAKASTGTED